MLTRMRLVRQLHAHFYVLLKYNASDNNREKRHRGVFLMIGRMTFQQRTFAFYVLLIASGMLFLEYQIATTNINGSQEIVLPWFVLVVTGLSSIASVGFWFCNRRNIKKLSALVLIAFPIAVYVISVFIRNNFGGLSSGAF